MSYQKDVESFMEAGDQAVNKNLTLIGSQPDLYICLLYTSDAADE